MHPVAPKARLLGCATRVAVRFAKSVFVASAAGERERTRRKRVSTAFVDGQKPSEEREGEGGGGGSAGSSGEAAGGGGGPGIQRESGKDRGEEGSLGRRGKRGSRSRVQFWSLQIVSRPQRTQEREQSTLYRVPFCSYFSLVTCLRPWLSLPLTWQPFYEEEAMRNTF